MAKAARATARRPRQRAGNPQRRRARLAGAVSAFAVVSSRLDRLKSTVGKYPAQVRPAPCPGQSRFASFALPVCARIICISAVKKGGDLPKYKPRLLKEVRNARLRRDGTFERSLLALPDQVVFPHILSMIPLTSQASEESALLARLRGQTVIVCKLSDSPLEPNALEHIHHIGTEIALGEVIDMADEGAYVLAQGRRRVQILSLRHDETRPIARVRPYIDKPATEDAREQVEFLLELFQQSNQFHETVSEGVVKYILSLKEPGLLCDALAAILPLPAEEMQQLLELANIQERLDLMTIVLSTELRDGEFRDEIHSRLQEEIAANQREMYLREQLRIIQQELGEGDVFQQEALALTERINSANLPAEAQEKALKEVSRLNAIPPMSPESGVIHTYLDRLLTLPWQVMTEENLDLAHAENILERAHYGLDKVKARIIEHIAVRKLAGDKMKNPILCFVGPPGVGKTSLGKSIANALGCKFLRISLGGVRDEAEIRGHRRTYIGSMPGRILQQMERAESINPVFMLDEIDKMSSDFRGDPASAMLELLDPEQNSNFVDHYLEVAYDLSKVTFITTANDLYAIPEALEDRLEVIEFKGYSEEEKIEIARRFLIPKQLEANGIAAAGVGFSQGALQHIVRHYTYESGVRNLEREIAKICRKTAHKLAAEQAYPRRILPATIEKLLGPPKVLDSKVNRSAAVGIVSGLVWTPNGGEIQTVEVTLVPGKGNMMLTGQLGDVLQESAHIALSYLRARAAQFNLNADCFDNVDIHIHMPEGAVPKDGPSAGITLTTALISAFTERRASADIAMTGEITLRGAILPVGGVVEKTLAARRRGIPQIILPKDNRKDLHDLPKAVLRDLRIRFVDDMRQALDLVLQAAEERQPETGAPD
ncbi:MAG: endopeptidase La [Chloroflexi bacterium]|nr:endopeptidase La [Chloroflexota bacterium]